MAEEVKAYKCPVAGEKGSIFILSGGTQKMGNDVRLVGIYNKLGVLSGLHAEKGKEILFAVEFG